MANKVFMRVRTKDLKLVHHGKWDSSSSFEHEGTALSSGLWCPPCCVLPDYWSGSFNPVVSRRNTPQLGRGEDPEFTLWLIGHAGRVLVIELKKKKWHITLAACLVVEMQMVPNLVSRS